LLSRCYVEFICIFKLLPELTTSVRGAYAGRAQRVGVILRKPKNDKYMGSEILIILVGFFKWAFKGFKTDLNNEIYGQSKSKQNIRGQNYFIGLFIFILIILLLIYW
jgi:hypothetical protein